MKKIEWVKLDTGFFEDEKIVLLLSEYGSDIIVFFIRLLTLAGKQNQNGLVSFSENIPYSLKSLGKLCQISAKKCENFIKILEKFGLIFTEIPENFAEKTTKKSQNYFIFLSNWNEIQNSEKLEKIRQKQTERAKKYREKLKNNSVTEALQKRDEPPLEEEVEEEEVEEDKEKEKRKSVTSHASFSSSNSPISRFTSENPEKNNESLDKASLDGEKEKVQKEQQAQEKSSAKEQKEKQKKIAQDVLKFLNETTGRNFRFTQSFQSSVFGRLNEGYTAEEFCTVIQKKTMEWKGTEYEKFLAPDTLFRPSKFDKYLNQPWPKEIRQPPKGGISSWDEVPEAEEYA